MKKNSILYISLLIYLAIVFSCTNSKLLSGYIAMPLPKVDDSLHNKHIVGQKIFHGEPIPVNGNYQVFYENSYNTLKTIIDNRTGLSLDAGLKDFFSAKFGFKRKKVKIVDFTNVKIVTLNFDSYNLLRGDKLIYQTIVIGGLIIQDTTNANVEARLSQDAIKTAIGVANATVTYDGSYAKIEMLKGQDLAIAAKAIEFQSSTKKDTALKISGINREFLFDFLGNTHYLKVESENFIKYNLQSPEVTPHPEAYQGCLYFKFGLDGRPNNVSFHNYCPDQESFYNCMNAPNLKIYKPEAWRDNLIPLASSQNENIIRTYQMMLTNFTVSYHREDILPNENYKIKAINTDVKFIVRDIISTPLKKLK